MSSRCAIKETAKYADVALGHQLWYDGTGGYPAEGQSLSGVMWASMQEWQPSVEIRVPKPVRRTKGVTFRCRSLACTDRGNASMPVGGEVLGGAA